MKTYILTKSPVKGKRFRIDMNDHYHDFASDVGKTYIEHQDNKLRRAWIARHQTNPNYNSKHSGIYHSRKLLWSEPTLKQAITKYEKEHGVKLVNRTNA